MGTIKRPLARATAIGKGVAKGLAGFLDFKKVFQDAVRKHKWQQEEDERRYKEQRTQLAFQAGYRPQNMGSFLAGGNVPMEMGQAMNIPGFVRLPNGQYRVDPTYQRAQQMTPNQALNLLADPFKAKQLKSKYPEIYRQLEEMVKRVFGGDILNQIKEGNVKIGGNAEADIMDTNW